MSKFFLLKKFFQLKNAEEYDYHKKRFWAWVFNQGEQVTENSNERTLFAKPTNGNWRVGHMFTFSLLKRTRILLVLVLKIREIEFLKVSSNTNTKVTCYVIIVREVVYMSMMVSFWTFPSLIIYVHIRQTFRWRREIQRENGWRSGHFCHW